MNVLIPQTDVTPAILLWDFVVPLYHATKSRCATADVATTNKHGFCNTFLLYDTTSQNEYTNYEIVAFFLFESSD